MKVITVFSAAVVSLMAVVRCDGDDLPTAKEASPVRKTESLTKAEYLHKAYVLRQGIRPPIRYTGTWRTWHENGNPQSERSLVNGVAHGPSKQWDTQGKRIATGEYRDGYPFDGSFRQWYHLDGDLAKHCYIIDSYRSGRRHGPYSKWTVSGQKLAEGQFADDKRTGRWRWWNLNGTPIAVGTYKDGRPWSGSFASRSDHQWRVQEYDAGEDVQLRRLKKLSLVELSHTVTNRAQHKSVRWHATLELARRKEPSSKPLLITLLKDDDHSVRGAAAWGLCQIGGKDAQDALLAFLRASLTSRNWGDLTRATEAQKELPDPRALPLLLELISDPEKSSGHARRYAAIALGKIGDPRAAEPLAKLLDPKVGYSSSHDYLYLDAIASTKGHDALPGLLGHLEALVNRLRKYPARETWERSGARNRQMGYDYGMFRKTVGCLEAICGVKSRGQTYDEKLQFWQDYLHQHFSVMYLPATLDEKACAMLLQRFEKERDLNKIRIIRAWGETAYRPALDTLANQLNNPRGRITQEAKFALKKFGKDATAAVVNSLRGAEVSRIRYERIHFILELGDNGKLDALIPYLTNPSESDNVRTAACNVFTEFHYVATIPHLVDILAEQNIRRTRLCLAVKEGLEKFGEPGVAAIVAAIEGADNPDHRANLIWALMRANAQSSIPVLTKCLQDKSPKVRRHAKSALWQVGGLDAAPKLLPSRPPPIPPRSAPVRPEGKPEDDRADDGRTDRGDQHGTAADVQCGGCPRHFPGKTSGPPA